MKQTTALNHKAHA